MRIDDDSLAYLEGRVLSNGRAFPVAYSRVTARNNLLVRLATGRHVLHMGCADHVELIEQKRRGGHYLHDLLVAKAASVVGADVNAEALAEMERHGIRNLYRVDELPAGRKYDVVMVPDVIEHVPDVGSFLEGLRRFKTEIVVTTPNAFRFVNRTRIRSEMNNSDHRYWFSPYTLCKTLVESGYTVEQTWYTDQLSPKMPVRSAAAVLLPMTRNGIAVRARPQT